MIKEVIVVEGKSDTKNLQRFFKCDTIETHGLGLTKETIEYIKKVNTKRGVILFLDPDTPGEKIRKRLNEAIPNLKNAFVLKENAKTKKKVGIEHANKEVLQEALNNLITYKDTNDSLSYADYLSLNINGEKDASKLREKISKAFHIGKCNNKTMYKRLNMLGISLEEIKQILE